MKILSYNIWFNEYKKFERLDSLISLIAQLEPDILCFQEVTQDIFTILESTLLCYNNVYPLKSFANYGCIIFSKIKFEKIETLDFSPFTQMGRELQFVKIKYNDKNIIIGNSHFESEFKKYNFNKINQFKRCYNFLNNLYNQNDAIILCADTNISNESDESNFFSDWNDCWEINSDEEKKYTYDYKTNNNLKDRKIKLRSRIDRIVFKGDIEIINFDLIKGITGLIEPSDHHGLFVYLE